MTQESPDRQRAIFPEDPHQPTSPWSEVQENLAAKGGLSLLLVEGVQPPALAISNNNSICQAIQSSPEHATLCDLFCGEAHRRAHDAGGLIAYRCHAGLHCFATPVKIGKRDDLAVIGGRAFLEISEYRKAIERFRGGDLQDLFAQETFDNVIFGTNNRMDELARNLQRNLRDYNNSVQDELVAEEAAAAEVNEEVAEEAVPAAVEPEPPTTPELEREIERLRGQLEHQTRLANSLQYFLEQISSSDPAETYLAALTNSKDLLHAERASLFLYDETTDKLTVKAAFGIPGDIADVSSLRLGEGIAGETLESRRPLVVRDLEAAGMQPAPTERLYKTKSFISYPITVSGRRVGVLNVTDKSGGGNYDEIDLSLLEIVAPQLGLALERAEWQAKATQFQLMSITDPLTGLHNRRYLEERLTEEVSRSKRYEQPLSFLMIDIDDFKLYNDRNGHQAGDAALQITAQGLKSSLRSADVAARYGGEEFCVLLPQTSLPEAGVIAERMREKIEHTQFPHAKSQPLGAVTISIGVSTFNLTVSTAEQIIWAADRALYEAKHEGKNKISFHQDLEWKATGSK